MPSCLYASSSSSWPGPLFFFLPAHASTSSTDWMWFGEVGYRDVYSTEITRARRARRWRRSWSPLAWLMANMRGGPGVHFTGAGHLHHPRGLHRRAADARPAAAAGHARGGRRRLPAVLVRVEPVDDGAHVVAPVAVRQGRSGARPRRQPSTSSRCRCSNWPAAWPWAWCVLAAVGAAALYVAAGQMALTPFGVQHRGPRAPSPDLARGGVLPDAGASARGSAA